MIGLAAFHEHSEWVRSLREQHAASSRDPPQAPAHLDLVRELERGAGGPSEEAWRGHRAADGKWTLPDASLELEDCDGPIFRGLNYASFAIDAEPQEVGHEPVFRSLDVGDLPEIEDNEKGDWLASMPPLVTRQRAGPLRVGIPFDGFN
ncbi:MAG: hypothetical protein SGPRY_005224 [Prymnesium sp.]